jgi:hypothetical protein
MFNQRLSVGVGAPMKLVDDRSTDAGLTSDSAPRRLVETEDRLPLLSEIRLTRRPVRDNSKRRERALLGASVAGIAVVTLCAIGLAWWGFSTLSASTTSESAPTAADPVRELPRESASPQAAPVSGPRPEVAAVVDGQCRELRDGPVSVSAGRGGVSGGGAVIERFAFGVYVLRSASAARSVVDAKGAVSPISQLQQWINDRPQGTRHCVKAADLGRGNWAVETTEMRPEAVAIQRFYQIVRTRDDSSGRTWITSISADPKKGK